MELKLKTECLDAGKAVVIYPYVSYGNEILMSQPKSIPYQNSQNEIKAQLLLSLSYFQSLKMDVSDE